MRLLVFSDLHRDRDAARSLVERSGEADVVIAAGDFAVKRHGIDDVIDPAQTRPELVKALRMLENKVDSLPPKKHGNIPL